VPCFKKDESQRQLSFIKTWRNTPFFISTIYFQRGYIMNRLLASAVLVLVLSLAGTTLFASSDRAARSAALPTVNFIQSTTDKPSTQGTFSLALPTVSFIQSTTDKPSTKGTFSLALPTVNFIQSTTDKPSTKGTFSLALPTVNFIQSTTDKPSTKGTFSLALPTVNFIQSTTDKPSTKGTFSLALPTVILNEQNRDTFSHQNIECAYRTKKKYAVQFVMIRAVAIERTRTVSV
jgi:hypothetical protein